MHMYYVFVQRKGPGFIKLSCAFFFFIGIRFRWSESKTGFIPNVKVLRGAHWSLHPANSD